MAVSYRGKTQNPQFCQSENSIMSIQIDAPMFEHIHGLIVFIPGNAKRMTFWGNARIFSMESQRGTAISGRREYERGLATRQQWAFARYWSTWSTTTIGNTLILYILHVPLLVSTVYIRYSQEQVRVESLIENYKYCSILQ